MTLHQKLRRTLTSAALLVTAAFFPAIAEPNGEIELAVTQKPPKLMSGDALVKYFSGALRATYRSDEGRPIEVAFRAWLVTSDGKMANECTSRSFEIAPGRSVGSDILARGFENCWPTRYEKQSAELQLLDLGPTTVDGKPVNLGLWDPNVGLLARRNAEDAKYFVAIVVFATNRDIAERVRTSPRIFGTVYPSPQVYPPQQEPRE